MYHNSPSRAEVDTVKIITLSPCVDSSYAQHSLLLLFKKQSHLTKSLIISGFNDAIHFKINTISFMEF